MENLTINYPEMHGETSDAIQAEFAVNRYRVKSTTPIEVKRGIEFNGIVPATNGQGIPNKNAGKYTYYMTNAAFEKFRQSNSLTLNILLD